MILVTLRNQKVDLGPSPSTCPSKSQRASLYLVWDHRMDPSVRLSLMWILV